MEHIKKICGINLLVLLGYMVLFNVTATGGSEAGLQVLLLAAFAIGFHVFITFVVSIILFIKKDPRAKAYLLSSAAVLVIGFSVCLGSASLY